MTPALRAWVAHLTKCDQCGQYARDYIRGCVRCPRCSTGQTLKEAAGSWLAKPSRGLDQFQGTP